MDKVYGFKTQGENSSFALEAMIGLPSRLKDVIRYSGMQKITRESLGDHTAHVAMIAGALARTYNNYIDIQPAVLDRRVNLERVYEMALYHDLIEVQTGDLPATFKDEHRVMEDVYNSAVIRLLEQKKDSTDAVGRYIYDEIISYERDEHQVERFWVKVADILQLISYTIREIDMGNMFMKDVFANGCVLLETVVQKSSLSGYTISAVLEDILNYIETKKFEYGISSEFQSEGVIDGPTVVFHRSDGSKIEAPLSEPPIVKSETTPRDVIPTDFPEEYEVGIYEVEVQEKGESEASRDLTYAVERERYRGFLTEEELDIFFPVSVGLDEHEIDLLTRTAPLTTSGLFSETAPSTGTDSADAITEYYF